MIRYLILHILLLVIVAPSFSQQLPLFSQNREYWSYINPAMLNGDYFKYEYNWSFGASYRNQWGNQEFTPRTAYARTEYFNDSRGFGFIAGGFLMHDQVGPTGFTGVYGRLAGVISRDPYYGALSIGFMTGAVRHYINGSQVRLQNPNDILNGVDQSQTIPDIGVGISFHHRFRGGGSRGDVIYGGVSIPQLLNLDLTFRSDNGEFKVQRLRHFFANLGYFKSIDQDRYIELTTWFKYVNRIPPHVDFSFRYHPISQFWIELGASSVLHIRPGFGINIGDPSSGYSFGRIGYTFEWLTGSLPGSNESFSSSFGNSHEISVVYIVGN